MDDDFAFDLDEILRNIDSAEVMSVFFPTFRKALILDTRSSASEGPMVTIMPMVASPQERLRSIRKMRPGFPRLRNLTLIPWPRYVDSLVRIGIWDKIIQRCARSGHPEAVRSCEAALRELRRLEKAELAAVVMGENYHTIWSARQH